MIYVGAVLQGAPDCNEYFGPVKVPGTMSKEETINKHIREVMNERLASRDAGPAAFHGSLLPSDSRAENRTQHPGLSVLVAVTVRSFDGKTLYHQTISEPKRGVVAIPFLNFLREYYPKQFAYSLRYGESEPDGLIFGFNIKQVLRIAAFELLKENSGLLPGQELLLPVRLWHNPVGCIDPLDVLLTAADQKEMDLYSVLRYFGIKVSQEQLFTDSMAQVSIVEDLVLKAQLV